MAIHGTSGDPQDERTLLPEVRYHSRWLAEQRCSTEDVHSQVPLTRPTMETRTSSRASKALLQTSHATRDVDGFRHAGAVKGKIYSRRSMCRNTWPSQWILRSSLIAAMILFFFASTSSSYKCTQFHEDGLAEIVPKDDIVRPVNETFEVLCHHDPELLANDTIVQFLKRLHGNFVDVPSTRINESTISTELTHNVSEDYNLYCVSFQKKTKLRKHLCYRRIFVGYPPLDFLDFRCRAPNRESLDCSWSRPANSVPTKYTYAYRVPNYKTESMQIDEVGHNNFTFNLWPSVGTRSDVIILVTANNKLGSASFSHSVNTYEVVVPPAAKINNKSIGTDFVKVTWNLTYLMDSMSSKLIQEVSYRIPPQQTWTSKRDMAKYTEDSAHKHIYFEKLSLPHAGLLYEVRIRTHTKVGEIREDYWSAPSYVNVTTLPLPPEKSALTNPSSFEVRDALRSRDLYIYWQQVDRLHHNGPDLHYSVMAYNDSTSDPMLTMPVLSNGTYAMFGDLEFNVNYRFEITVVNAVGQVADTSQVIVPTRSQLQLLPVPAMFTVINYYNPTASRSPIQRLMWKAPDVPEAIQNDLRYILYWCPRNPYSARCEENLAWESAGDDLNALRLHDGTRDIPVIYQRNLTGLGEDLQFGIAAVQKSTNMSSGIKWASCSVFHADSPPAPNKPIAVILSSSSVRLSWKFECRDKSAVPLQVNISYCENMADGDIVDFSGCTSPLKFHLGQLTGPALIEGLRPSAKIIFAISLVTIVGESQPSQAITVQMLQDVPGGPPSSLNITAVTSTTISLEWSPPEPHLANGNITSYEISTQPPTTARMHPAGNTEKNSWMLSGLAPYTQYVVSVAACTQVNRVDRCAVQHPAIAYSTTDPGVPDEVNMFSVNSVRGQVSWAFEEEACHSQKCSFDLEILYNDTLIKQYNLTQNSVSLKDLNVTCRQSKTLTVSLRAVGVGLDGSPIYGPWTAVDQSCSLAGSDCSDSDTSSDETHHSVNVYGTNVYVTNVYGAHVPLGLSELVALIRGSVSSGASLRQSKQKNVTRHGGEEQSSGKNSLVDLADLIAVISQNETTNLKGVGAKENTTGSESLVGKIADSHISLALSSSTKFILNESLPKNSFPNGFKLRNNPGHDLIVNSGVANETDRILISSGSVKDEVPHVFSNDNVVNINPGKNFNRSDVMVFEIDGGNDSDLSANRSSNWSHPSGLTNMVAGKLMVPVSLSKSMKTNQGVSVTSSISSTVGLSPTRTSFTPGSIVVSSKSVSSKPFRSQVVPRTDEERRTLPQSEDTVLESNKLPLQVSHSTLHFNKTRFTHKPVNKYNASNVFNMNFEQLSVFNINGTSVVDLSINGRKTNIANHSRDSSSASDDETVPEISPVSAPPDSIEESDSSVQNIVYLVNYGTINILQNNAAGATETLRKRNSGKSFSENFEDSFSHSQTKYKESNENVFDRILPSRRNVPPPGSSELFGLLSGQVSVEDELSFTSDGPLSPSSIFHRGDSATSRGHSPSARTHSAQARDLNNRLRVHSSRPRNQKPMTHRAPTQRPYSGGQPHSRSRADRSNSFNNRMPNPTIFGEVLGGISSNPNVDKGIRHFGKFTSNDDVERSFPDSPDTSDLGTRRPLPFVSDSQRPFPPKRISADEKSSERSRTSDAADTDEGDKLTNAHDHLRDDFLHYAEPWKGTSPHEGQTNAMAGNELTRPRHSNEENVLAEYDESKTSINYSSPYSVTNYSERSSVQTNIESQ